MLNIILEPLTPILAIHPPAEILGPPRQRGLLGGHVPPNRPCDKSAVSHSVTVLHLPEFLHYGCKLARLNFGD